MRTLIASIFTLVFLLPYYNLQAQFSIHPNDIVLDLIELEKKGEIEQDPEFIRFDFATDEDLLDRLLIDLGYGYRISAMHSTWRQYSDHNYIIVIGTAAKDYYKSAMFVMLFSMENLDTISEAKVVLRYMEIGNNKEGRYPRNIIPYSLN